jgi:hypothetical protein
LGGNQQLQRTAEISVNNCESLVNNAFSSS